MKKNLLMWDETLFRDPEVLEIDYVPEQFEFRDTQMRELAFQIRHAGRKALLLPDIKAVDHSGQEPAPNWSNSQRATLAADRLNGAAHFLSKRLGFVAGTLIKLQAILVTLLRALTFQSPGYNWKLFFALIGGQKIDGSQGGV